MPRAALIALIVIGVILAGLIALGTMRHEEPVTRIEQPMAPQQPAADAAAR
ncbi:MAG: hypothetical protein PGN09_05330 [Sphingomonas fennica]